MRPPEQTWIPGTEPPNEPDVEAVKVAIYHWLDRKVEQKRMAEEAKLAHAEMLVQLGIAGIDWHPYLDPHSGKKKRVWIAKEPKAKTTSVPKPRDESKPRKKRGRPGRDEDAVVAEPADDKVETRRVPRAAVESITDPFGATRATMAGSILEQADAAQDGTEYAQPKKGKKP
jgi:hypothetical protein